MNRRKIKRAIIQDAIIEEARKQFKNKLVTVWLLGMISGAIVSGAIFFYLI